MMIQQIFWYRITGVLPIAGAQQRVTPQEVGTVFIVDGLDQRWDFNQF